MICVDVPAIDNPILTYAKSELLRVLSCLTEESIVTSAPQGAADGATIKLVVDTHLQDCEIVVDGRHPITQISGGSSVSVLYGVYTFLEHLGCVFEISGEVLPERSLSLTIPDVHIRQVPRIKERGIRMHLNFVQDQSFFSEHEFENFIDNMAKQKWNSLCFHMYTPQQWFPFSYQGIKHLDLSLGNLNRKPLSPTMIGRERVKVSDHWFPQEFEHMVDSEQLLIAVYERYQRMMRRCRERGIRNCVSFEPESMPAAVRDRVVNASNTGSSASVEKELVNAWQEGWSGTKLSTLDIRSPLMIDIAVERCIQCMDAFPDLDELQLISREGTTWYPGEGESFAEEIARLTRKFGLTSDVLDMKAMKAVVQPNDGPEMNPKAHPYWTVLPGSNFFPTVVGSLRFVEFALEVLSDPRVRRKVQERGLEYSIAVYSPNPETIRLMMPAVAAMLPSGTRFHCISDYSAGDIARSMPSFSPLVKHQQRIGVISWLEFDGLMMVAQSWLDSINDCIAEAARIGVDTLWFNHWRVRSLEHNFSVAAATCWAVEDWSCDVQADYFRKLYGEENTENAKHAYSLLEKATIFAKDRNYNIGFTADWVIRNATEAPGYYWGVLAESVCHFTNAADAFDILAHRCLTQGNRQAKYMAELCRMSALHIRAVYHLQNAKLPLIGYKAWPLGNPHASWPPGNRLRILMKEVEKTLMLEREYMTIYSKWVTSCDEQGQLVMHQQGVIEPLEDMLTELTTRFRQERRYASQLKKMCGSIFD